MKKPRKKPNPELRVRISPEVFKAVKVSAARTGDALSLVVEYALRNYPDVYKEME